MILETLSKAKNIDPQERAELMKKIGGLTQSVASSIAKDNVQKEKPQPGKMKKTKVDFERERLDKELEQIAQKATKIDSKEEIKTEEKEGTKELSNLEKLQRKYTTLKNMAANLGIDASPGAPTFKRPRRGRGGALVARGSSRGGRVKRTMVLDNRPTTLRVEVPKELRNSDTLLNHLKTFGEVVSFTRQGNDNEIALVQFGTRRGAEMALSRGKAIGSVNLRAGWNLTKSNSSENQTEQSQDSEVIQEEVYQQPDSVMEETEYFEEEEEDDDERSWKRQ